MAAETPAKNRFVDLLGQAHKTLLHNELELFVQCSFNNLKAPPRIPGRAVGLLNTGQGSSVV
jgi:hypothetical protein